MEINWQGINDFLTLKVAGEKQVLLYQYCIASIISWVLDEFLSSSRPGIVLKGTPREFHKSRINWRFVIFPAGIKPEDQTKVFSVIYKSLHEMLPSMPTKVEK